ncbi:MAG: DUF5688 family protein [Lachnospiraceae bacterium]|nr:DUF5688 family protein [Lachnospiraceae bacterium]
MDYKRFKEELLALVQHEAGEELKVEIMQTIRINEGETDNLTIRAEGERAAPVIPMSMLYFMYSKGENLASLAARAMHFYRDRDLQDEQEFEQCLNREYLLEHLQPRLIGQKGNEKLLEQVPHSAWLNLAVVYYCVLEQIGEHSGGILIRHEHLKLWDLTEKDLEKMAWEKVRQQNPAAIYTMTDLMTELLGEQGEEEMILPESDGPRMYVVTNQTRTYGACWITQKEIQEALEKCLEDDYFMLPSSLHECMVVPCGCEMEADHLLSMVCEINATQVSVEDRLSDAIYRYDRKTGSMRLVEER